MRALRGVELYPVINDPFCLKNVGDFMHIEGLLFQRRLQAFDKDVVQITAHAIHLNLVSALVSVAI